MQSIREIKPSNPRILSITPINGYLYIIIIVVITIIKNFEKLKISSYYYALHYII